MTNFKVFAICCGYIIFSSTTPTINKWLYLNENVSNITLSFLHCLSTFIGLQICERFDIFSIKSVHIDVIIVPAVLFCGLVTFMNSSLASNSLATYHIVKTIFVPVLCLAKCILKCKADVKLLNMSWVLIVTGALTLIYYDQNFHIYGTILLSAGLIFFGFYGLILKRKQAELQMNTLQLLYYFSLISSLMLCVCVPFVDSPMQLLQFDWMSTKFVLLVWSNLLVFLYNMSVNWISTNVVNRRIITFLMYLKLCLSMLQAWYLFSESLTLYQLIGLLIHIIGTSFCDNIMMNSAARAPLLDRNEMSM